MGLTGGGIPAAGGLGVYLGYIVLTAALPIGAAILYTGLSAAIETTINAIDNNVYQEEINAAGQTVVGRMSDLGKLGTAQFQIDTLCNKFNPAAEDSSKLDAKIAEIVATVEPIRTKVTVRDAGTEGASAEKYDFKKTVVTTITAVSVIK